MTILGSIPPPKDHTETSSALGDTANPALPFATMPISYFS
ncbi:hypothetical protein HOR97_gp58 [Agrobacterium phage Atu_ph03]|uniref:Uncharacterized protein n=2 Tax=Atuphduovirus TaxID=2731928 RepID=A0A2L0UZ07_9CAUD|nr:hypothetical protein HOR96_gp55 [Agrobacterium phage Atu_ph02]YP_009791899.1 hypothetical protein HOR97_gp58 [Agrobacterium phage Atu_ph03]AUZ94763.1 hypothetical protein [Agrobacterium phage Atu_ph02]AUZ94806.1 hypothetical protein [Agrobacterium phage Atu_ph03]